MTSLKFALSLFLVISSSQLFGQKSISKYCINLFSDTTINDTITISISYTSDLGERHGQIKLKRINTNYLIQVFWKRMTDSSGFLIEGNILDTSYYIASKKLLNDLRNDFRKAKPKKILELTYWTYTFIVPAKPTETFHDKIGLYLYNRLRYNSFLIL